MNGTDSTECEVIGKIETEKSLPPSNDTTIKSGIYGLRCKTTNKWYVGQSLDIQYRWKSYKRLECKKQRKLYNALIKYGYDDFDKIILEECPESIDILNDREVFWSNQHDSIKNGYNIRECGGNRGRLSEETKKLISASRVGKCVGKDNPLFGIKNFGEKNPNFGNHFQHTTEAKAKISLSQIGKARVKHHTDETKNKIRASLIGKFFGEKHPRFGKHHTEESRKKMGNANRGKRRTIETKKQMSESAKLGWLKRKGLLCL